MENKEKILNHLLKALQATRQFQDLIDLDYIPEAKKDLDLVVAHFAGGGKREINVSLDSGFAMIRDVIRHIDG